MEEHRLSAIMFTDIVGFTRKMGEDEVRMLRLLKDHCQMVETFTETHHGEIIKRVGDAFLINFNSALNAVRFALDIQKAHQDYNQDKTEKDQVLIRIGIHLGDIVIREDDIFGDGVNIASRIEPLAEPGGICVTRTVYDIVKKKMDIKVLELGPQHLKNVDEAVEVFHILTERIGIKKIRRGQRKKRYYPYRHWIFIALGIAAITMLTVILIILKPDLMGFRITERSPVPLPEVKVVENRVAILPLRNLTGDEHQIYFTEGLAEELIFRLSQIDDLYIYPFSDVLALGKKSRSTKRIKQALGVKYLVQGSLQQEGDSLIVVLSVIDTETLDRLSIDRYSAVTSERHNFHDRLVKGVLFPIVGRVSGEAEAAVAMYSSSSSLANDLYLQARHAQRKAITWDDQQNVLKLYESTIMADSSFALVRAHLAEAYVDVYGKWQNDTTWVDRARQEAEIAVALAPDLPEAHYALGKALEKGLQYETAETAYRRAVELRPDYLAPRTQLGSLYGLTGRNQEALLLFRQSLEISQAFGDRRNEATILRAIGKRYNKLSDYPPALKHYIASLKIYREIGNRKGEASSLMSIGIIRRKKGDYDVALEKYYASLKITREIGDIDGEASVLNCIGAVHMKRGDYTEAQENYEASLKIKREIGDRIGEASSLNCLGAVCYNRGDYSGALEYYQASRIIYSETENLAGEATISNNIGNIHILRGNYRQALEHYEQSLIIYRKIGNRAGEARIVNNIGTIYNSIGDNAKALSNYETGLKITREIGNREEEASILCNIGNIQMSSGDNTNALKYYSESLTIYHEIGNRTGEARIFNNIGSIHKIRFEYEQSLEKYEASLAIKRQTGDRAGEAKTMNNIGFIYEIWGEYLKALEYYEGSLSIYNEIGSPVKEAYALSHTGDIHFQLGDTTSALDNYKDALKILTEENSLWGMNSIRIKIGELLYHREQFQVAHDSLQSVVNNSDVDYSNYFIALHYLGACNVKLGEVEPGLQQMYTALDSLRVVKLHVETVQSYRILGELLLDIGYNEEASIYLTEGRTMADTTGMKGELNRYDKLLTMLQ